MTIAVALLVALPLAALGVDAPAGSAAAPPGTASAAPAEPARSRWYLTFGLGSGDAVVAVSGTERTIRSLVGGDPARLAIQVGGGLTVGPKLLVGLDLAALRAGAALRDPVLGDVHRAVQLTNLDLVLTFYPGDRGFFFRGGGGASALTVDEQAPTGRRQERHAGANLTGGVGYAWWLGRRFNFLLDLDASRHRLTGSTDAPISASFWMLYAGIGWY